MEAIEEQQDRPVICLCNSNTAWGGGERWHLGAALYFAGKGIKVVLAAAPGSELMRKAGEELEAAPELADFLIPAPAGFSNLSFINPSKIRAFAAMMREERVTHVIMGLPADLKAAVGASRLMGKTRPRLFYRRGSAIPVKDTLFNRFLYGRLDGLIANSYESARCVLEPGRLIADERVKVIPNGIDIKAFDKGMGAAQGWDLPCGAGGLVLGNAGRLNAQKGQKHLLHMCAYLKRNGFSHSLIIAGSGELEEELMALARKLGLTHNRMASSSSGSGPKQADVYFTGFLDDMYPFWNSIDIFVLSSLWEGFGYVLAEAMLAHKPLVAFDCNSMPELVKPGLNGELAAPPSGGEAEEEPGKRLGQAVRKIAGDLPGMDAMGARGRMFCEANFSQAAVMASLEEVLFGSSEHPAL